MTDKAITEIAKMKELKSLTLTNYVSNEVTGSMQFSSRGLGQLSSLPNLETLDFVSQPAPHGLKDFPKLKELNLSGPQSSRRSGLEGLNDKSAAEIAQASNLKYLNIQSNEISPIGWRQIGAMPKLRGISLPDDMTDSEMEALKEHGASQLRQIRVRGESVTPARLGCLAEFKSVTRLDLAGQHITEECLEQLSAFPNLQSLRFYNILNELDFDSLKQLTHLREIYLQRVTISQEDYNDLERALPSTRIYAGSGTRWLWSIHDQE